ncbi:MAG: hypothetical protein ABIG64_01650 [Candidatus Omnitrophota bacterium]
MQSKIEQIQIPLNNIYQKSWIKNKTVLALGPELKSNYAVIINSQAIVYTGFGDLKNPDNFTRYKKHILKTIKNLSKKPQVIACDFNPIFLSSQFARKLQASTLGKSKLNPVLHHYAHIAASCAVLNLMQTQVLGIVCDGTGLGDDDQTWGCEFIKKSAGNFTRCGHLNYIPLPGADYAVIEPWRVGLSLLYQTFGDKIFTLDLALLKHHQDKTNILVKMIKQGFNTPMASSAGRLFDGVAAILGFFKKIKFEAQAAVLLEQQAQKVINYEKGKYAYKIQKAGLKFILNTNELIEDIVADLRANQPKEIIAARFHNTFSDMIIKMAGKITQQKENSKIKDIVLSGGVFFNRIISDKVIRGLEKYGFKVHKPENLILSDAGLSLGQAVIGYVFRNSGKGKKN